MRAEFAALLLVLAGCATLAEPKLPPAPGAELAAEPLTRARCTELALQSVPKAAAWRARLDHARAVLAGAKRLPNPTLALNFEDLGLPFAASAAPVQTTLMLGEALAEIATRKGRTAAAQHELAAEEARLLAERDELGADVASAYDELVAARERLALDRELASIAESQRKAVARFVELGEAPRLELERAQAECLEAGLQSSTDESAARAQEIALAFALGFERPVALMLAEGLGAPLEQEQAELETLLAHAAQHNPRIQAATEEYAAVLEHARIAYSGLRFLPIVRAGPRTVDGDSLAVVELETELPLFDQSQSERAGASSELLAAAAQVRGTAHELARTVALAQAAIEGARKRVELRADPLAQQRAQLRARTQQQFEAGEASYLELVTARRDEVKARGALLDARLELAHARTQLALALGCQP